MDKKTQIDHNDPNKENEIIIIRAEEQIMGSNDAFAIQVRHILDERGIYCINLISSPGSGKTTLLVETLKKLSNEISCAVIEGDQQTSNDAQRISEIGIPVIQVNTLQSCHLNASQILQCINQLKLDDIQLLIIENVGNLVCPASMDLGENEKVVLMSVTEGEDKPEKYPLVFSLANVLILTKTDLLPYLRFDLETCKRFARSVNERIQIIETSSYSQTGMSEWISYLRGKLYN